MLKDLRFALRTLRHKPGFTLAVVLALCLGIGAASAMFSIIDGVLLRPLPFSHPERLINIWETIPEAQYPESRCAAPANYFDWRAAEPVFSSLGAYQQATFNLAANDAEPERYPGRRLRPRLLRCPGSRPLLGRSATDDEMHPAAMASWS